MKKFLTILYAIFLVFGVSLNAGADRFTDVTNVSQWLNSIGTIQWNHATPVGFLMTSYTLNSGQLTIMSYLNHGTNQQIQVQDTIDISLNSNTRFGFAVTNVMDLYVVWDEGDSLYVAMNYDASAARFCGMGNFMRLGTSVFCLGYKLPPLDGSGGAPVPEPATMILFGLGLIGMSFFGKRNFILRLPNRSGQFGLLLKWFKMPYGQKPSS